MAGDGQPVMHGGERRVVFDGVEQGGHQRRTWARGRCFGEPGDQKSQTLTQGAGTRIGWRPEPVVERVGHQCGQIPMPAGPGPRDAGARRDRFGGGASDPVPGKEFERHTDDGREPATRGSARSGWVTRPYQGELAPPNLVQLPAGAILVGWQAIERWS